MYEIICGSVFVSTFLTYSGTSPYDHPVYKTTSLLRPYSFKPNVKTIDSVYYFEDPVNATTSLLRPGFYGPTVVALTGFHCIWFYLEPQKLCFCFFPLRFLGVSNQATLYSCFVLTSRLKKRENRFSRDAGTCRTTIPSCYVKETRNYWWNCCRLSKNFLTFQRFIH